jgi:hypothetical protein
MIAQAPAQAICYPPAPLNGGPLETAPAKVGSWIWQPKVDDWRAVLHVPSGTVWNQYGQPSSITDKFTNAIATLQTSLSRESWAFEWLDVGMMENRHDLMRGCIIVLDWILFQCPFYQRRAHLRSVLPSLPFDVSRLLTETGGQVRDSVYLISQWDNCETLTDALKKEAWLQNENTIIGHKFYEGLVAKRRDSLYTFGRKTKQKVDWMIKHRFDI